MSCIRFVLLQRHWLCSKICRFCIFNITHPVKVITTGEGGAILTNNKTYDKKAKLIRSHGMTREKNRHWEYKMDLLGYNFRLPDINFALD